MYLSKPNFTIEWESLFPCGRNLCIVEKKQKQTDSFPSWPFLIGSDFIPFWPSDDKIRR